MLSLFGRVFLFGTNYRFKAKVNTPAVTKPKPPHSCVLGRSSKKTTAIKATKIRWIRYHGIRSQPGTICEENNPDDHRV